MWLSLLGERGKGDDQHNKKECDVYYIVNVSMGEFEGNVTVNL